MLFAMQHASGFSRFVKENYYQLQYQHRVAEAEETIF